MLHYHRVVNLKQFACILFIFCYFTLVLVMCKVFLLVQGSVCSIQMSPTQP